MNKFKKVLLAISLMGTLSFSSAFLISCRDESKTVGISFNEDGAAEIEDITVKSGEEVVLPVPVREGYRFDGWYTNQAFEGDAVTTVIASKDVTYYAKWTQVFAVNLDLDGGVLDTTKIFLAQGENVYDAVKDLQPTKSGLTFGAWFKGDYELSSDTTMKANEMNLTARYKVEYTVEIYLQNVEDDEYTKTIVTNSEYVGKNFTSTQKITGFTETTEDTDALTKTLSANAEENVFVHKFDRNMYTVRFDLNCPGEASSETISVTEKYQTVISVPSDLTQYQFKGYCFLGWTTGVNSTKVEYPADLSSLLYNKGDDSATAVEYPVEKTTTLYGVWQQAYTDMFGGDDYIYYLEGENEAIYLCRANVYFKGEYDAKNNVFYFDNENGDEVLSGKLYDNKTYVYYDTSRMGTHTLYRADTGEIDVTEKITFDAYNGIRYRVYEPGTNGLEIGQEIDVSMGTYEVAANGDYVAKFTSGRLENKVISFFISSLPKEDGGTQQVFQVRNEDEYQVGKIILVGIRRNDSGVYDIGYADIMYFELDGFGTAKFTSNGRVSTYKYVNDDDGNILLKNAMDEVVETIRLVDIPGSKEDAKGYVVYNKAMNDTFDVGSGATLTLDGLYNAVYTKDGKAIKSYYRYWTNPMGGTIISIIDPSDKDKTEYKFLLNPTTKQVGGEEVKTYTAKTVLNTYAEYYYMDGESIYYAPMLVIDETESGWASLYGYTSDRTFQKVSDGTYTLIKDGEYKGLYQYILKNRYDAPDIYSEPIDIRSIQSFMFALDTETTGYSVNYWYSSNDGSADGDTIYFVNYENQEITSDATLKVVGGFAFYKASANEDAVIGTYTQTGTLLKLTVDETTYYFSIDEANKKFKVLQYAPYTAYLKNTDGTYSDNAYLDFDGYGGAVYTVNGVPIEGTIAQVTKNDVAMETKFGEKLYKFTPTDPAQSDKAFEYICVTIGAKAYYAVLEREATTYYSDESSKTQGTLTIDGYCYWAEFSDFTTKYEGLYYVDGNVIVLEAGGRTFYFDFPANDFSADDNFTVRGEEYGTYALFENQYSNGVFVELDGYGNLSVFTLEPSATPTDGYKRNYISESGTYEIEDGVYTFTYSTGTEAKAYVCLPNTSVYEAVDGESYTTFAVSKDLGKEVFVDANDWSVLILDEFGRATKVDKNGQRQEGKYTFITDTLLYFVDTCLYEYNMETGEATPIQLKAKSYYTEDLKSLYFSEAGFAIFNGDEGDLCFYNYVEDDDNDPENDEVIIYSRAQNGEQRNEFGFTSYEFGTLEATKEYHDETYYKNDGKDIVFTRSGEKEEYPILATNETYYLTELRFSPTGAAEFYVKGRATFEVRNGETETMDCYITREIVDREAQMYVTVGGYYRYYVEATYTNTNKSYKVDSLRYMRTLDSYYYLNEYFYTYLYEGEAAAKRTENKFGTITIEMDYDVDGSVSRSVADVLFGENSDFYDMNGNRISCKNAEFSHLDDGTGVVEFVASDDYTYQLYFGIYQYPYMTAQGYYIHALVRIETIHSGDYLVSVGRTVASERPEEEEPLGRIYTVELQLKGEPIACDEFFYSGEKLTYIVREKDQDGYVQKATYYTIDLVENENSSIEEMIPTYHSATVTSAEATIMCEKDPIDPDANYKGKDRYVEIANGEIKVLYLVKNKRYAKTCTYDDKSQIYTVETTAGWTYYVKIDGENVVITDDINDFNA